MLLTIATVAVLSLDPVPSVDVQGQPGFEDATVETLVRVTPERFFARNTSELPQVILFGTDDGLEVAHRALPPGGILDYDYPTGTSRGLAIEVLSMHAEGWRSSGPISILPFTLEGFSAAWVAAPSLGESVWFSEKESLRATQLETLLPAHLAVTMAPRSAPTIVPLMVQPTHVPVITPSDKPKGDAPPRLEDKPLPPV